MQLQPGQIVADKYRIVRLLGHGGMGAVFEGENLRIHRKVAIKTLHAQVSQRPDVLQRFEREAQAAGRIGSEHIVEVLDMGDLPDGARFMVMEFLEGVTLGDRIVTQGRIPPRELVGIMVQLLEGLGAAHQAGIIHRDLKPANVFLLSNKPGRPDFVKILDFGVSKFNALNAEEMSMTRTGAVVGTPYYMSPEQAKGARNTDHRSDVYSAGVIIYEAITGQVPFNADTFNELIFKIALEAPPPPEQFVPHLDPQFSSLMRRAMAREVGERFQSAFELRDALLAWARDFDARGGRPMLPSTSGPKTQVLTPEMFGPPHQPQQQGHALQHHPAHPPPVQGQGHAAHYPGSPHQGHAPQAQAGKQGGGIVPALVAALVVGGLAAGGWFGYRHFAAPTATASEAGSRDEPAAASTSEPDAPPTEPASAAASADPAPTSEPTALPSTVNPDVDALPPVATAPRLPTAPGTGTLRPPPPTTSRPVTTATAKPSTGAGRTIGSEL